MKEIVQSLRVLENDHNVVRKHQKTEEIEDKVDRRALVETLEETAATKQDGKVPSLCPVQEQLMRSSSAPLPRFHTCIWMDRYQSE